VRAVLRRVSRLEHSFVTDAAEPRSVFRIVFSSICGELNIATSTCTRTLCPKGLLAEYVRLDGLNELTETQLEAYIQSFPIERLTR
jgi:hypothetical protein